MLIRYIRTGQFDKFIFHASDGRTIKKQIIKRNETLYIDFKKIPEFLRQLIGHDHSHGNTNYQALLPFAERNGISVKRLHNYQLRKIGISINSQGKGHIEIKYKDKTSNDQLVLNIHVHHDRHWQNRDLQFYETQLIRIWDQFLRLSVEQLHQLETLNQYNFKTFDFRIAWRSSRIYRNLKDYSFDRYGNRKGYVQGHSFQERQRQLVEYSTDCAYAIYPLEDYGYRVDPAELFTIDLLLGKSLFSTYYDSAQVFPDNNFMHIDFTIFPDLFKPEHCIDEVDVFDGGGPAFSEYDSPRIVVGANFRHSDLRNLDFANSSFENVDFTGADLRGVQNLNFEDMDQKTLNTLLNAHLSSEVKTQLDAYIVQLQAKASSSSSSAYQAPSPAASLNSIAHQAPAASLPKYGLFAPTVNADSKEDTPLPPKSLPQFSAS
jgi:hypothetical protein